MLPKDAARQFAACAGGAFDDYFRQYGQRIAAAGAGHAVVRLGWEANKTRPWSPSTAADIPDYVTCFQREAAALRSTAPDIEVEWAMGRISNVPFNVMDMYPGDEHVDVIGVHYYDNVGPKIATQAAWDQHYMRTYNGGPAGLGTWLAAAKSRGKRLAVSEWGVWDQGDLAKADNPVYVENMYRFFRDNAADIAYENYYNRPTVHQLFPSTRFAQARARYQELWSAGQ
jgi:beta-mannanase